jgi:hypothetical protein
LPNVRTENLENLKLYTENRKLCKTAENQSEEQMLNINDPKNKIVVEIIQVLQDQIKHIPSK